MPAPIGSVRPPISPSFEHESLSYPVTIPHAELRSQDHRIRVQAIMAGPPVPSWTPGVVTSPRPRRRAVTEWNGNEPLRLELPLMIDNFKAGRAGPVEEACRSFEKMAGLAAGDPEPPPLQLRGTPRGLIPHDFYKAPHVRWLIETLTWGASERGKDGRRLRQELTVTLVQEETDERLERIKRIKRKKPQRTTRVREDETLRKIAKRLKLSGKELREMKKINKIRDADKKLKKGRRLKVP